MEIELRRAVGLLDHLGRVAWKDSEEITITHNGKPYLKLVPHPDGSPFNVLDGTRGIGLDIDESWVASELPETSEEIIEAFEGKWSNDSF